MEKKDEEFRSLKEKVSSLIQTEKDSYQSPYGAIKKIVSKVYHGVFFDAWKDYAELLQEKIEPMLENLKTQPQKSNNQEANVRKCGCWSEEQTIPEWAFQVWNLRQEQSVDLECVVTSGPRHGKSAFLYRLQEMGDAKAQEIVTAIQKLDLQVGASSSLSSKEASAWNQSLQLRDTRPVVRTLDQCLVITKIVLDSTSLDTSAKLLQEFPDPQLVY